MKNIEAMIPAAAEKIEQSDIVINCKDKGTYIPQEYKSYISSFGASVTQSGLLPALAFYHSTSDAGKKRTKIMKIVFEVLKSRYQDYCNTGYDDLYKLAKNKQNDQLLKSRIMNAAVAVKLALRTYKFEKK